MDISTNSFATMYYKSYTGSQAYSLFESYNYIFDLREPNIPLNTNIYVLKLTTDETGYFCTTPRKGKLGNR